MKLDVHISTSLLPRRIHDISASPTNDLLRRLLLWRGGRLLGMNR
jgi:hypothetical protein